jgi:hypothetical protein
MDRTVNQKLFSRSYLLSAEDDLIDVNGDGLPDLVTKSLDPNTTASPVSAADRQIATAAAPAVALLLH